MTLDTWLGSEPRCAVEILDAFLQAGRALAQAHAQGLVHRDFRPRNVLRATSGRIIVTDFGPARSFERTSGAPPGPATDQLAFCASLWDALGPSRLSRPLRATLRRGLDPDPAARWPSMHELLDRISRTRSRARILPAVMLAGVVVLLLRGSTAHGTCLDRATERNGFVRDSLPPEVASELLVDKAACEGERAPHLGLTSSACEHALGLFARGTRDEALVTAADRCGDDQLRARAAIAVAQAQLEDPVPGVDLDMLVERARDAVQRVPQRDLQAALAAVEAAARGQRSVGLAPARFGSRR